MACLIRCIEGHIFDQDTHDCCPVCGATITKVLPPPDPNDEHKNDSKRSIKPTPPTPVPWLIAGFGGGVAILVVAFMAWQFLLKPQPRSPLQPQTASSPQTGRQPANPIHPKLAARNAPHLAQVTTRALPTNSQSSQQSASATNITPPQSSSPAPAKIRVARQQNQSSPSPPPQADIKRQIAQMPAGQAKDVPQPTRQVSAPISSGAASTAPIPPALTQLFSDDFKTMAHGWGTPNRQVKVANNALTVGPLAGEYVLLNWDLHYRKETPRADISATVTNQRTDDMTDFGGLVFWAKDSRSFYEFLVSRSVFSVARMINGKLSILISWTHSDALAFSDTRRVSVDVIDEGDAAYFEINGTIVGHIRAPWQLPGDHIGVSCGALKATNTCFFSNFSVKVAFAENSYALKPGDVVFDDDFTVLTPDWGKTNQHVSFQEREGQPSIFQIHTRAGGQWWRFRSDIDYKQNGTPRVDISLTANEQDVKNRFAAAGLIFWAKDSSDFYEFFVGNGAFGLFRRENGKFFTIIPWTQSSGLLSSPWPKTFGIIDQNRNAYAWIGDNIVGLIPQPTHSTESRVGLVCLSSSTASNACTFSELKLTVAPTFPSVPPPTGPIIFTDNFRAENQDWGGSGIAGNGIFRMQVEEADQDKAALNRTLHYRQYANAVDIRAKLALPGPPIKRTYGGLIFWAKNTTNYYSLTLGEDDCWVYRTENGHDKALLNCSDMLGENYDHSVMNQLEVMDRGSEADFLVDGKPVGRLLAPSKIPGDRIGFACGAGYRGNGECAFADLTVSTAPKTGFPHFHIAKPVGAREKIWPIKLPINTPRFPKHDPNRLAK